MPLRAVCRISCALALIGLNPPLYAADDLLSGFESSQSASQDPTLRGVLRARNHALVSSELAARIVELPFRDGQVFAKGDVLVRFDCAVYQAQLRASKAGAQAAREELKHKQQLADLKSVGHFEVALAQARHAQAQADTEVYSAQLRRCTITAPFAGHVVQLRAQPHESVAAGAPLLEVVDNTTLEIHLLMPSSWLNRVAPGQHFSFTPDETGQRLTAAVKRLGARIDEGSQTLLLIGELSGSTSGLLAGMSGSATFEDTP